MKLFKKSQIIGEVVKYFLVLVVSFTIILFGYIAIKKVQENGCAADIANFEIELRNLHKSVRFGAKELRSYYTPCDINRLYFFDLKKDIKPEGYEGMPIIEDSLKSGTGKNVFLVKGKEVIGSFYAGNLEIPDPYSICLFTRTQKISFFVEGTGIGAEISAADIQSKC